MNPISAAIHATWRLFFPTLCAGCQAPIYHEHSLICQDCLNNLPKTNFANYPDNPLETWLSHRMGIKAAHSEYYFLKGKTIQSLIHALKYHQKKEIGTLLGIELGKTLKQSHRFDDIDCIVPVPMRIKKMRDRGYNQAALIATAVADVLGKPVCEALIKTKGTHTQTKKGKLERWRNTKNIFSLHQGIQLPGKHILLIDDVLTTGATLEACAQALRPLSQISLSIATIAYAEQR